MRRYTLRNCDVEIGAPVEVGRAPGHFWFPTFHLIEGQEIFCEVVRSDDVAQGKWPATLCLSRDGGMSWTKGRDVDSYGHVSSRIGPRKILIMPYELGPLTPGDKRNAVADGTIVSCSAKGRLAVETTPVKFCGFPRDLNDYHVGELRLATNGNILSLRDGQLFTTLYGGFVGETKENVFALTSDDRGLTWRFRSIVAVGADIEGATEGADESNTVRCARHQQFSLILG